MLFKRQSLIIPNSQYLLNAQLPVKNPHILPKTHCILEVENLHVPDALRSKLKGQRVKSNIEEGTAEHRLARKLTSLGKILNIWKDRSAYL